MRQGLSKKINSVDILDAEVETGLTMVGQDRILSVLACLDGTPVSSGIILYAQMLAKSLQTDLHVLTVLESDHEMVARLNT